MKYLFVYILKCYDSSFYIGVTSNLLKRIDEHNSGKYENAYTHARRPVKLIYYAKFNDYKRALAFEKQIKKWNKSKKEALINEDFDLLKTLSKNKKGPSSGSGLHESDR